MQILNDGFGTRHISTTAGILTSELLQHGKQNTMQATHIHKNEHNKNGICQLRNWTQSSSTAALGIFAFLFHHITYLSLLESGIKTGKWASYLALWSISSSTSESIKLRKKKHYPPMPTQEKPFQRPSPRRSFHDPLRKYGRSSQVLEWFLSITQHWVAQSKGYRLTACSWFPSCWERDK